MDNQIALAVENNDLETARFLAEVQNTARGTIASALVLARVLVACGDRSRARAVLGAHLFVSEVVEPDSHRVEALLLHTHCAPDANTEYRELITLQITIQTSNHAATISLRLGHCCRKLSLQEAHVHYAEALRLDPLCWAAYRSLCELGHDPNPNILKLPTIAKKRSKEDNVSLQALRSIASCYAALSTNPFDALSGLASVPLSHRDTSFVLEIEGRAHFSLGNYKLSSIAFQHLRSLEPLYISSCSIYATVLWQLKDKAKLSLLAAELQETHPESPETHCVIGNKHSLDLNHTLAITHFKKATTINPSFLYAFTLLGHEYSQCDDLDNAIEQFRKALRIDPRHFIAWSGLANVYLKSDRVGLAEYCLRRGASCGFNPVLKGMLSMVLMRKGDLEESQAILNEAIKSTKMYSDTTSRPVFRVQSAQILFTMGKFNECAEEISDILRIEKCSNSSYSSLHVLRAKCYQKMGRINDAVWEYTIAQDIGEGGYSHSWDGNGNSRIRDAMEKLVEESKDIVHVAIDGS